MPFSKAKIFKLFLVTNFFCWIVFIIVGCGGGAGGGGSNNSKAVPDIGASENPMDFGGIVIDNFADRTLTIKNHGSAPLSIGQIAQANPLGTSFTIINDECTGKMLKRSKTCLLQVRFTPSDQKLYDDSFDIPSNDPDEGTYTVFVSGDGRALNVSINQVNTDDCGNKKIKLFVTVTDKMGDPVTGLTETEFTLFENNFLKAITDVRTVVPPVSITLALDNSSSITSAIPAMNSAAKSFVDQMAAIDEGSIIKFAKDIITMQGFTVDKDALKAAIDAPFPGDVGGTKLYDTVWQAVENLAMRTTDRKIVIMISDGNDYFGSVKTLTEVIDRANERGIPVFTIGLGDVNAEVMQKLADETGGQYYYAPQSSDLEEIYLQIADVLAEQYVIEYISSSSGSGIIILDLEVDINNQQGEDSKWAEGC